MRQIAKLFWLILIVATFAGAQQPQTSDVTGTQPLDSRNVKYVQGVGPGYWPTAGSGLTLNLTAGTVINASATPVTYAGGTLTMTNNTTNYVYLNSGASFAPASNTSGFSCSNPQIAKVTTSGGVITAIVDVRNAQNGCVQSTSPGGSNGNLQYNNSGAFGGFADGTSHQVLHGGKTFSQVDLTNEVTGVLPVANGGNGSASPTLSAGTNVSLSGSWPNYTISATNSGGGGGISGPLPYFDYYCNSGSFTCSTTVAATHDVVAHKIIIATCAYYTAGAGAGTPTMSDTGPGGGSALTWHQIATAYESGQGRGVTAWWADPAVSGSDSFTCGNSGVSISFGELSVTAVYGATLASPIDVSTTATGNAASALLTLTTTGDNEFVYFFTEYGGSGGLISQYFWNSIVNDGSAAAQVEIRLLGPSGTYYFPTNFGAHFAEMMFAIH